MPFFSILRLGSILTVAALWRTLTLETFMAVYFCIVMSHYLLGFFYSYPRLTQVLGRPASRVPLAALAMATAALAYFRHPNIDVYFGLHHALNEAYFSRYLGDSPGRERMAAGRFFFNLTTYYMLLRGQPTVSSVIPSAWIVGAWCVSAAVLLVCFFRARRAEPRLTDLVSAETLALALVAASFYFKFLPVHVMLYHFIFWMLFPLVKKAAGSGGPSRVPYLFWTIATMAGLSAFTWLWGSPWRLTYPQMAVQIVLWGYVHINLSFAVSSLNPEWVRRRFA